MKRLLFYTLVFASTSIANAQVAKWIIPPAYKAIHKMGGGDFIVTDSADTKILWSWDGRRLAVTRDQLFPFNENLSVAVPSGTNIISGFYDTAGHFTPLGGYSVALGYPVFSCGYLLVMEGQFYRFVNTQGKPLSGQYKVAYPFSNGYAVCYTYRNMEKQKDPHYLLLTTADEEVPITYNGKTFGDNEIEFISSVNDENVGFIVAGHKLYRFDGKSRSLSPVFARAGETDLRNQARLDQAITSRLVRQNDTTQLLTASCGSSGSVQIWFDNRLVPRSIQTLDGLRRYTKNAQQTRSYATHLRVLREEGKMGLFWDTTELLPPQLDQVTTCYADIAFVRQGGRYGAIKAFSDRSFSVSINDGNPIAFRHRTQPVSLSVELPNNIPAQQARLIVQPASGLTIDEGSYSLTDDGRLHYDGLLTIPESLPDELYNDGRNDVSYPVAVSYDGLLSPTINIDVKAWHQEYHTITVDQSSINVSPDGQLRFNFTVTADSVLSGSPAESPLDSPYPITVSLQADGLQWNVEDVSDTQYRGVVHNLYDGPNSIVIVVEEQGCPPLFHRFNVTYNKPPEKKSTTRPHKTTPKSDDKGKQTPKRDTPTNPVLEI